MSDLVITVNTKGDWRKPVNAGFEVFRLGDDFIVEIKHQNHWVDYAVWEIASAEYRHGSEALAYLDEDYQFTDDRDASPPDIEGHAKWDNEMCFHCPHRMRQLYGVGSIDKEVQLLYWIVAVLRNQFGDDNYGPSGFFVSTPEGVRRRRPECAPDARALPPPAPKRPARRRAAAVAALRSAGRRMGALGGSLRKGWLRFPVTLIDRSDQYYNGMEFIAITLAGAQRAAWAHAQRIVDREASFDINGYSVV